MAKKKQSESVVTRSTMVLRSRTPVATKSSMVLSPRTPVATRSTMVLRPRTPVATKSTMVPRPRILSAGEEKVKEKLKGKKTVAGGKIGMVNSEKGEIIRKRKVMADWRKTETAENIVKRVKTMNNNEMDKGPTKGSIRVLGSYSAKKGDKSRKEVVSKGSVKDTNKRIKTKLPAKKEAPLAIGSLGPILLAKKETPLIIRSPKLKQKIQAIGSTRVLRPRTLKAKGEMSVEGDEKTKGTMPVEVNKKIDGKKTVGSGKMKIANAVKTGTAAKRKFVTDKVNTEVAGSRLKKLKAVIKKNEMHKDAETGSIPEIISNRKSKGDESGNKDVKKGSAEAKTKKLKKNFLRKKEASITIQSPSPKKIIHVKKKAFPTIGSTKPEKNFPAQASKGIAKKGGKLEDHLSKERAKDIIANNHRNVQGFKNHETGTNRKNQLIKRKKTNIIVTDSVYPPEIIMEILSWLPVKFLGAPMVVCKQWYALIQDRHFIEKHMKRTISCIESEVRQGYEKVCSCDGLQLEVNTSTRKYRIRNPDTKHFLELPDAHIGSHVLCFAYVPLTLNYKIVSVYKDENSNECREILSVGNDELSWRLLKMPTRDYLSGNRKGLFPILTGDVVHCVRTNTSREDVVEEVVSLDLGTEEFCVTNLPKGQYKSWQKVWPIYFKGKLALVDIIGEELWIMVLENYKKQKWGEKEFLVPLELMKKLEVEHGALLPHAVDEYDNLWFWVNGTNKFIYYDILNKYVSSENGHRHSLVRLKGMQPE